MSDDGEDELDFNEEEMEQVLEGLYRPGAYADGEQLCLEILEDLSPDWEPARLFLLLNLAAQDAEEEALQMVDELSDESLFEALRHLTFGADTETEELIYLDIMACIESRGLKEDLEKFFNTEVVTLTRTDIGTALASWDD